MIIDLLTKFQTSLIIETGRSAYELTVPEVIWTKLFLEIDSNRYNRYVCRYEYESILDAIRIYYPTGDIKIINGDRIIT